MTINKLLEQVKLNLIIDHSEDDKLLESYIIAAISYAESYQHINQGFYKDNEMPASTLQAVVMLASHFYESRDGSTGGFFNDNVDAADKSMETINMLLRLDRKWKV